MDMTKAEEAKTLTAHMDIVKARAHKYRGMGVDLADLIQEGSIGALKGMRNWSPDGGESLRTHISRWADAYIRKAVGVHCDTGKLQPRPVNASLDAELSEDGGCLLDVLPQSTFGSPEDIAATNERVRHVEEAMVAVKISDREVAILRSHVIGEESLEDVGASVGISRARAGQLKDAILPLLASVAGAAA